MLQRVQVLTRRDALDGQHLTPVDGGRQGEAADDAFAVDRHRARPAQAVIAALLGAGQLEPVAQQVEQRRPHVGRDAVGLAVDAEFHLVVLAHQASFEVGGRYGAIRLSSVIGRSRNRFPVAWKMAFAIAAGTPHAPISPMPRTPIGSRP